MEENREALKSDTETSDKIEKDLDSILEEIPKEERHYVRKMIGMSMQMGGVISPQLELMKKMTPGHVTEFLKGQREATELEFKESRDNKFFLSFVLAIVLAFIIILIVLLKDKPEIMEKVIYAAGGFVAGIAGGYGYGKTKNDN